MKVMNISDRAIYLNTEISDDAPLGLNRSTNVRMDLPTFQEKNPVYTLNVHYIVIADEYDNNEISIDPIELPIEIIENAPRIVIEPELDPVIDEVVKDEMLTAMAETIEEAKNHDEEVVDYADAAMKDVCKTLVEWQEFFQRETKATLKEFAELREIKFPQNINKVGVINLITNWLKINNLITEKENE